MKNKEPLPPRMKLARKEYVLETRRMKKIWFNWCGRRGISPVNLFGLASWPSWPSKDDKK